MAVYYNIRYLDQIRKKWLTSRDKLTEAEALERYIGTEWEVVKSSREERKDGMAQTLGRLYRNQDGQ